MRSEPFNSLKTYFKSTLLCVLNVFFSSGIIYAEKEANGVGYITTLTGNVTFSNISGEIVRPELHSLIEMRGLKIATSSRASVSFVLSNGSSFILSAESELIVERFKQLHFEDNEGSFIVEPSTSQIGLELIKGTLTVTGERLSPLSKFEVKLPEGTLRVHSAISVLEKTQIETKIAAIEGRLTFYFGNDKDREFMSGPYAIRLTEQSAKLGRVNDRITRENFDPKWIELGRSVEWANNRILFQSSADQWPPQAIKVVPADYYEQDSARPYNFIQPAYRQ